jgi:aerobic carbon-monoxide dehydrogenase small subunit
MSDAISISFNLNGSDIRTDVQPQTILADLIRDECALTGTKIGCDQATCGACTVLVDGVPVAACATFAWQVDGKVVYTIEWHGAPQALDKVREAFKDKSAFQCGYCTPGMIMLTRALLTQNRDPDRTTISDWLSANVCRCTGYQMIIEAVEDAARRVREDPHEEEPFHFGKPA